MSFANNNFSNVKIVDSKLVDKILEQGQKLRNSMVESILKNDPFCTNIIYNNKHFNSPRSSSSVDINKKLAEVDSARVETYLKGEFLTKDEEKVALETIRSMSIPDLFKTTEKSLLTNRSTCKCSTCTEYGEKNLSCDLRRSENIPGEHLKLLRFVDCLKITVHSLFLNESGYYKVFSKLSGKNVSFAQRYFVEYNIPDKIVKRAKNKSKVDSGLDHNSIRICSRQNNNTITFKHVFIHDISHLHEVDLETLEITFKISYRNSKLKNADIFGNAKFNFGTFKASKNFSCNKELPVYLENNSIVIGHLKVLLQLGNGKLYFGKELIDALSNDKHFSIELNNDDTSEQNIVEFLPNTPKTVQHSSRKNNVKYVNKFESKSNEIIEDIQKQVLFGFVYILEAQFNFDAIDSYVSLQPFCQNDTSYSRHIFNTSNPVYNFSQLIPLIYDDELLLDLRENFMLIEFWRKDKSDNIFGLTRVSLHQFYLAYRNSVILKYLSKNKYPIISCDGFEPIYSLEIEELLGKVQVLVALGTEEQIRHLEVERGLKNNAVQLKNDKENVFKPPERLKTHIDRKKLNVPNHTPNLKANEPSLKVTVSDRATNTSYTNVISPRKSPKKVDIAIQSDAKMDEQKKSPTQEMLGSFLTQLLAQKQRNIYVENSTNTESVPQNLEVRKTSDLLDTLHKALSSDGSSKNNVFKAGIAINSANQLPIKRRYRSKKTRSRKDQIEEALPSTYVTFESMAGSNLKITQVVPKSTAPKYDYNAEVELPLDLLTNNQKKLVFKVWKKSTNITNTPNLQTDIIVGFATLDLTVLLAGLPNVQGWFNIVDFSGKCNGQINIHVNPLEDLSKFQVKTAEMVAEKVEVSHDESGEMLSRTLKRKFNELDEITQNLRLRLSEVTKEDSENSNDEFEQEFEKDINSLCIEDDFNMINFDQQINPELETLNLLSVASSNECSENSSTFSEHNLNKNLLKGKQKIDSLLEKLTLISNDGNLNLPFGSRYVSGCSVSNENRLDTEAILKDLDKNSRPNIQTDDIFSTDMYNRLYKKVSDSSSSGGSVLTTFGDFRGVPEGEGNKTEEINKKTEN